MLGELANSIVMAFLALQRFGYTSFTTRLDNADGVLFSGADGGDGDENVLAVHVDALKGTGWWYVVYSGAVVIFNMVQLRTPLHMCSVVGGTRWCAVVIPKEAASLNATAPCSLSITRCIMLTCNCTMIITD